MAVLHQEQEIYSMGLCSFLMLLSEPISGVINASNDELKYVTEIKRIVLRRRKAKGAKGIKMWMLSGHLQP